jgi:uncharacterized membrane protein
MAGVAAGAAVFAIVGLESLSIGEWWVTQVPSDTNRAAAMFTFLLVPPGAFATELGVGAVPVLPAQRRSAVVAGYVLIGVMMGAILGSFVGSITASLSWAINCPQTGDVGCFTLSSVIATGLALGALSGIIVGVVTGYIAYLVRRRPGPSSASPM